jgi:hypothetical protein
MAFISEGNREKGKGKQMADLQPGTFLTHCAQVTQLSNQEIGGVIEAEEKIRRLQHRLDH